MTLQTPKPPSFWKTVRLLLGATRRRSRGRRARQQELLNQRASRSGASATNWGFAGVLFGFAIMAAINVAAAFLVDSTVSSGERIDAQRAGKIVVSAQFLQSLRTSNFESSEFHSEAHRIEEKYGGGESAIEQSLRNAVRDHGDRLFVAVDTVAPGIEALPASGALPAFLGSIILFAWIMMLVFQGEGLELDLQRRRHPHWEWLFSHPVPSGPVFLAEMISPLAANPMYWAAPVFPGLLFGFIYGPALGFLAVILVGIPISIACASLGKALEIAAVLRFPLRTRGAMIGIMSWLGYASMMLCFLGLFILPRMITAAARFLALFAIVPWPWLRLFLGGDSGGGWSFTAGVITCELASVLLIAVSVWFSAWAARRGLSGNFAAAQLSAARPSGAPVRFGREPLYRKEFLWFIRDRSAIVQTILIPLTVAGVQLFNLRVVIVHAQSAWNYPCGAAIIFGTYFLWVLGPKSLASEGAALWISLTWPRGLESLLKAKAWLWSLVSTGLVSLVLVYGVILFPHELWKILLVGVAWFLFSRTMSEKSVTLVTVVSESGDAQPVPKGRRWGAQLGMLTFSIGILTEQWHIAVMGIVYSWLTAAAMWENFRAHLPFLYDPWSETLPQPPTLLNAMICISILVEVGAIVTGILTIPLGRDNVGIALAISYGICAVIVCFGASTFLKNRGVYPRDVWNWTARPTAQFTPNPFTANSLSVLLTPELPNPNLTAPAWRAFGLTHRTLYAGLACGTGLGLALASFARGYLAILARLPYTAEIIHKSREQMASNPTLKLSYFITAVFFAPFAEEYLFRGLLFRALDREWGGWRAVLGAAAFFAIYHPPLAWIPVGLVGAANCLLFKRTRSLAPAVLLHMVYNAIVLQ